MNCYSRLVIIILLLTSGCNYNTGKNEEEINLSDRAEKGEIIDSSSYRKPEIYKAPEPGVLAAHVIDVIDYQQNQTKKINSYRRRATAPEKREPGCNDFAPPTKIKVSCVETEVNLPEITTLKSPIQHDFNPLSFISHSKAQGLLHDDITCFYEDKSGNIWIGSYGGGLMRFDGQNLAYFDKFEDRDLQEILSLEGDLNENIWIGTTKGLFKFNGYKIYKFNTNNGLLHNSINSLKTDQKGNLWISYNNGGISKYDGRFFHHFTAEQGMPVERQQLLNIDKKDNVWISYEEGLVKLQNDTLFLYDFPEVTPDNPVLAINTDNYDNVWFSIYNHSVVRFSGSSLEFFSMEDGFPSGKVYKIIQDAKERLWFGSWGNGVIMMENDQVLEIKKPQGLVSDFVNSIFEDKNGIIWMGTLGGMTRYFGDVFRHYQLKHGFDQQLSSVAKTPDGQLWACANGGMISYDGKKVVHFSSEPGNPEVLMEGMFSDSKGNLWLSINEGGIYRFDGHHYYHYDLKQIPAPFYLRGGMEDKKGNIWFLTGTRGIIKYDGINFIHFTAQAGLPLDEVIAITEDRKGNIWLATETHGVFRYSSNSFIHYTKKDGLASNNILSIYADSEDNIWIGTDGNGLSVFNGSTFLNFSRKEGLTDNFIFSITQAQKGDMIFGGRFGLNMLTYNNLVKLANRKEIPGEISENELLFINYTNEDGFLGVGCNLNLIMADNERIWIGTNDRLTAFFPENSFFDTSAPKVRISKIELFNEPLDWRAIGKRPDSLIVLANGVKLKNYSFDNLSRWYQVPENLKLAHNNNFITFHVSAIAPASAGKILYTYTLEGFEEKWHTPTKQNTLHYGNLPPGEYTLRVKAMNRMGNWSRETDYSFEVKTPWYKTWWAWIMYYSILALLLVFFIRMREKELVLKNRILDNEVELARKSLEIKQNIIANVSHELRTPLTGIIGITNILGKTNLDEAQKEHLITLKQSGNNLLEIINQILDYSKIESGEIELKNSAFSIKDLFSHAQKLFSSLAGKSQDVVLKTNIDQGIPELLYGDRGRINQIINNLLFNAVKFTHKGSITLTASIKEPCNYNDDLYIKISVKDTGIGICQNALTKLFVPFSQIEVKDNRNYDSTGLGLAISKKLTKHLGGEIGVESQPGVGSNFWFTFRVKKWLQVYDHSDKMENSTTSPGISSKRILLVEDKKVNQTVIRLMLEELGHKVEVADNGEHALDAYKHGKFDIILMDIQMPVMDGITATRKLKENFNDLPPVIGLSANAFEGDRKKYMDKGMDEYITKPVTEESIIQVFSKFENAQVIN